MRPPILYPLFAAASTLKGVGAKIAPLVERVAGSRVRDLLFLAPVGMVSRTPCAVAEAEEGAVQTFSVRIDAHLPPSGPGRPYRIRAADQTGFVFLSWFKTFGDHLARAHPLGARRVVSGRVERYGVELQIAHPDYLLPLERAAEIPAVEAVYPGAAGLPPRLLRRLVREAVAKAPELPEWQDAAWLARQGWPSWREALEALHAPRTEADLSPQTPARRRLAYDELLAHHLAIAQRKRLRRVEPARPVPASDLAARAEAALPFALTGAQRRTLAEVRADLMSGCRMNRLVQGDVGSGKTVVAMLAMIDVLAAGGQSALMAPTEILARQHFETLAEPLRNVGVSAALLTGRDKAAARQCILQDLASGAVGVVVGTHALFQDEVAFADLRLSVIDEQHRFGVAERRRLQEKGAATHLLALSATPIPRTLEMAALGDLDASRLDEKPPGRTPPATTAAPAARLGDVVDRLGRAVARGAQAFWICPLAAHSDAIDATAAEARAATLRDALGPSVGLVHGRLPPAEKDAAMAAFVEGRTSVLVATTVVEVGVNVPRATIMVIEHAERFGLAQLHQLRGRVGRGGGRSACLLLYDPPLSATAEARLNVLRETDDGFVIAERDLELRGGGDLMGLRQSGLPDYRLADPAAHRDLLLAAADDARLTLARDPELTSARGQALRVLQALYDWKAEGWSAAG